MSEFANAEIFASTTLLVALGTSFLTQLAGLSLALGAFLAGLLIAETEYALQVESDIAPYKVWTDVWGWCGVAVCGWCTPAGRQDGRRAAGGERHAWTRLQRHELVLTHFLDLRPSSRLLSSPAPTGLCSPTLLGLCPRSCLLR
eukprot:357496-Chlamydomonas_euryale.AAC.5